MTELVTFMVKSLVDKKDAVEVTLAEDGIINVKVDKDDIGKVIGKDGRIAKAIRTIVKAAANKQQAKYSVVILEE
ncbi:MAG: KH domain-containing protein [Candidatus Neoclostridium sp.]